jgi:hypothetical protein
LKRATFFLLFPRYPSKSEMSGHYSTGGLNANFVRRLREWRDRFWNANIAGKKNLPFFSRGRPRNEKNQREVVEKNGDAKYWQNTATNMYRIQEMLLDLWFLHITYILFYSDWKKLKYFSQRNYSHFKVCS